MPEDFKFKSLGGANRGKPYELDEFRRRYNLDPKVARGLFKRFGPSSVELDLLMAAKLREAGADPVNPAKLNDAARGCAE